MIKDIIFQQDNGLPFQVTGKVISDDDDTIVFEPLTEDVDMMPEQMPAGFIMSSDYAVEFGEMACLTKIYTEVYVAALKSATEVAVTFKVNSDFKLSKIAHDEAEEALNAFGKQFGLTHIIKGLKENG